MPLSRNPLQPRKMSKPLIHAKSSAKKFGGKPSDYLKIHTFMDSSKNVTSLPTHRALTHNTWFIGTVLPAVFGETFKRESDGVEISTRDIGEQHVSEDFKGFIPSASDFIDAMIVEDWMMNGKSTPPSHALISDKLKERRKLKHAKETKKEEPQQKTTPVPDHYAEALHRAALANMRFD
jgi:hypothetical protein